MRDRSFGGFGLTRRRFLLADGTTFIAALLGRRLIANSGGSGSFPAPIPEQGRWIRNPRNPILTGTVAWETRNAVQECSVFHESGIWKMWYHGGWHNPGDTSAVGYATSADGVSWTKDAGNPVFGNGVGGESSSVHQPCVMKIGSTWWMYYNDSSQVKHAATSSDGLIWTRQTVTIALPLGMTVWGDSYVWTEGATWYGLFDCAAAGAYWRLHLFTSTNGLTWSALNGGNQLSSLQIAAGSMYGSAFMLSPQKHAGDRYQLWYHAAPTGATVGGNLPTDLYHAWSTDLINWTIVMPNPILTHLGGSTFEKEQVADARLIEVGGASYIYYSGVDDTGGYASVGLAQFAGTLAQILAGT